jgi:hypothetical protein
LKAAINKSYTEFGFISNFVQREQTEKRTVAKMEKSTEIISKPRTALFQERENDEPKGQQIIHEKLIRTCKVTGNSGIQFGLFSSSEMQTYMKGVHGSADTVPGKSMYAVANFHKKNRRKEKAKTIYICWLHQS